MRKIAVLLGALTLLSTLQAEANLGDSREVSRGRYGDPIRMSTVDSNVYHCKGYIIEEWSNLRTDVCEGIIYTKQTSPISREDYRRLYSVNIPTNVPLGDHNWTTIRAGNKNYRVWGFARSGYGERRLGSTQIGKYVYPYINFCLSS